MWSTKIIMQRKRIPEYVKTAVLLIIPTICLRIQFHGDITDYVSRAKFSHDKYFVTYDYSVDLLNITQQGNTHKVLPALPLAGRNN